MGRALRSEPDAEDVAQEVFLRICARIADFDRSRDGVSWAFAIAGYEIMTQRKRKQRRREASDDALSRRADHRPFQEELLIQQELATALAHVAGTLSPEDRRMIGLESVDGTALAVSGAALRKRRQRAVERLRAAWRRIYGRPE